MHEKICHIFNVGRTFSGLWKCSGFRLPYNQLHAYACLFFYTHFYNPMSRKLCSLLMCYFSINVCKIAILLMSVSILSVSKALMIALTLSAVLEFSLRRTTDMQIVASHYASSFCLVGSCRDFCVAICGLSLWKREKLGTFA